MKLEVLFQHPHALPTAPNVVRELINSFTDDAVSIEAIAKKLSADPVLTAKLLRLANSAYYHVSRSVSTVDDAVMMLGFVTVRTLVISSGLVSGFKSMPGFDLKHFWRYSLHAAVSAKWIAKQVGQNTDEAFTIGMMHAIGQLVIHTVMPEQSLELDKTVPPLDARRLDAERTSFGYDFSEVGAELAARWKFPDTFATTLRAYPQVLEHKPLNKMAAVIHLAAWRARAEEHQMTTDEVRGTYPGEVAASIGLSAQALVDDMPPLSELTAGLEELIA